MAHAPELSCHRCGAALAVPQDPQALAARCAYCGAETVLPPHVVNARRAQLAAWERERQAQQGRETVQKLTKGILTWTAVGVIVPMIITVVVLVIVGVAVGAALFFAR